MATDRFQSVGDMIAALKSEDPEERLQSMRGLHLIASTLGPDRVKGELLPFLTDYPDESDDVLVEFAKGLATMVPLVGGVQHVAHLLGPLELLCGLEDITVRDEAIKSMCAIAAIIFRDGSAQQQREYTDMVLAMAKHASSMVRYSVCFLLAVPYSASAVGVRTSLRQAFQRLCTDDEIMVRRGAAVALGDRFAKALGDQCVDMVTVFTGLAKDASDGVRLQCVPTAVQMLPLLPEASAQQLVQVLKGLATDHGWRVRYMVADKLPEAVPCFPEADIVRVGFAIFKQLCSDAEPEIRASAVFGLNKLLALSRDPASRKDILTVGCRLSTDVSPHVRVCLASVILKCSPHVAKDVWNTTVTPVSTKLLQDADPDVKLALVSGFSDLGNTAEGREIAPRLVPVVISLAQDPKWRVRETVVRQLPSLIASLSRSADEVLDVCVQALSDRVATIREVACEACKQLVQEQGLPWAKSVFFPRILPLAAAQAKGDVPSNETVPAPRNFLRRVTFVHLLQTMLPILDAATVQGSFGDILAALSADVTPNVRLNTARLLVTARNEGKAPRDVASLLATLQKDTDTDVRSEASRQG